MNDPLRTRQALRSATYEEALAERLRLNVTDLRALELVLDEPGLTPGRLAERSGLTTGAVTGVVDRLEKAGYVERKSDANDRRRAVLRPTAAADEVRQAIARIDQTVESLLSGYLPEQQQAIRAFLDATASAVSHETATLRASVRGGFVGKQYQAPLGDAARGLFYFASGAPRMSMNIAPLGPRAAARVIVETSATRLRFGGSAAQGNLLGATFDGPLPDVRAATGAVRVRYSRSAMSAVTTREAKVALSSAVPWAIEIEGGLTDLVGSLAAVSLDRLELDGGANHIDLELPKPSGTAVIRIRGVVSSARFVRPRGAQVALRVDGGISHLTFDGRSYKNVSGARRVASRDFASSEDRYEIDVRGGASSLEIVQRR
ncbi:MAG TPA: MarR family transcriptional regulator [Candidatus Limnocylindrales bacterium]|jgi:DNA-binding MarR family transcriptional regulator